MPGQSIRALPLILAVAACNSTSTAINQPLVVGFSIEVRTAPPASSWVGAPVPVVFLVLEHLSDGTVKRARDASVSVSVVRGNGTINGASTTTLQTAWDGTDSVQWVMGSTPGTQSLRGALSAELFADVSSAVAPLPTLLVTNATCVGGHCDSLVVLGFPDNQPHTPGGLWNVVIGVVVGAQACLTLPPSTGFTIYGPNQVVGLRWTPDIRLGLGTINASASRLFAMPSTEEYLPAVSAGARVTMPGGTIVPDAACTP